VKKTQIEAGVAGFIGKLESIVSFLEVLLGLSAVVSRRSGWLPKISQCPAIQPTPVSSSGNQGTNLPDRGGVEGTSQKEGAGKDIASDVTGTGHNAGVFVASKNADDDAGRPTFRIFSFTNRCRPQNTRNKRISQSKSPMKHHLSSDWMGRLQDWGRLLLPEERIGTFG